AGLRPWRREPGHDRSSRRRRSAPRGRQCRRRPCRGSARRGGGLARCAAGGMRTHPVILLSPLLRHRGVGWMPMARESGHASVRCFFQICEVRMTDQDIFDRETAQFGGRVPIEKFPDVPAAPVYARTKEIANELITSAKETFPNLLPIHF